MKNYIPIFVSIVIGLSSCAHDSVATTVLSVKSVVHSAAKLEGQRVTISGYLRFGDDSRNLWSSEEAYSIIKGAKASGRYVLRENCIALYDIENWRRALLSNDGKNVLVDGVVHRIPLKEGEITLSECSDLGVSISSIRRKR